MICPELNAKSLLHRHCVAVPRPLQKLTTSPDEGNKRLIKDLFDMRLAEPYKVDQKDDRDAFEHMDHYLNNQVYDDGTPVPRGQFYDGSDYMSKGPCWKIYHALWSEENMINFWDFRKYYKQLLKRNIVRSYRCQEIIMPVEHLLMEYCSVGRIIKDTECSNNKEFNMFCWSCKEPK